MSLSKVAVIGMGYVGLTLSAVLAKRNFEVVGIEKNLDVVHQLQMGEPHFHEQNLASLLQAQISNDNLIIKPSFSKEDKFDVLIICVGTPYDKDSDTVNMDFIISAAKEMSPHIKKDSLVLLRSTVPLGTTRNYIIPILEAGSSLAVGKDFSVAFTPERTIEGKAIVELESNPQIVGGYDSKSTRKATDFFSHLTNTIVKVESLEASEMVKIIDNTYRDVSFAYSNEISNICEKFNIDATDLIKAANTDYNRNNIPFPSPGVGGACLSKDPYILIQSALTKNYNANLIREARKVNENKTQLIIERIENKLFSIQKKSVPVFFVAGFAFKGRPETSDLRDSTTLWLLTELQNKFKDSEIRGFDPVVEKNELEKLNLIVFDDFLEGCKGADVLMIMNNHPLFESFHIADIHDKLNKPAIFFDSWRMFDRKLFEDLETLSYMGVGF